MHNRWYHRARFYSISNREKNMTWVEQMLDLVFAISVIQFSKGFFSVASESNVIAFVLLYSFLWVSWLINVFFYSRYVIDDFVQRFFMILYIFTFVFISYFAQQILNEDFTNIQRLIACLYF